MCFHQCYVRVEDDEHSFTWIGPGKGRVVEFNVRRGTLENHYDIGDELGRGTQGITYHVIEHFTGNILHHFSVNIFKVLQRS